MLALGSGDGKTVPTKNSPSSLQKLWRTLSAEKKIVPLRFFTYPVKSTRVLFKEIELWERCKTTVICGMKSMTNTANVENAGSINNPPGYIYIYNTFSPCTQYIQVDRVKESTTLGEGQKKSNVLRVALQAFQTYDATGDGSLNIEELRKALKAPGSSLSCWGLLDTPKIVWLVVNKWPTLVSSFFGNSLLLPNAVRSWALFQKTK